MPLSLNWYACEQPVGGIGFICRESSKIGKWLDRWYKCEESDSLGWNCDGLINKCDVSSWQRLQVKPSIYAIYSNFILEYYCFAIKDQTQYLCMIRIWMLHGYLLFTGETRFEIMYHFVLKGILSVRVFLWNIKFQFSECTCLGSLKLKHEIQVIYVSSFSHIWWPSACFWVQWPVVSVWKAICWKPWGWNQNPSKLVGT